MMRQQQQRPLPSFVLTKDEVGWRTSDSLQRAAVGQGVTVVRGSLLSPAHHSVDTSRAVAATMVVRDMAGVRVSVFMRDVVEVTPAQAELLAAVRSAAARHLLVDWAVLRGVRVGASVQYCAPAEPPVPALVRFVGAVPEVREAGYMVGLEVTCAAWALGDTDGRVGNTRYFSLEDPTKGIICDISFLKVEEIHSRDRLESLNRGTVEKHLAIYDNNNTNVTSNNLYKGRGRGTTVDNREVQGRGGEVQGRGREVQGRSREGQGRGSEVQGRNREVQGRSKEVQGRPPPSGEVHGRGGEVQGGGGGGGKSAHEVQRARLASNQVSRVAARLELMHLG